MNEVDDSVSEREIASRGGSRCRKNASQHRIRVKNRNERGKHDDSGQNLVKMTGSLRAGWANESQRHRNRRIRLREENQRRVI